jgi:hypothetical protein
VSVVEFAGAMDPPGHTWLVLSSLVRLFSATLQTLPRYALYSHEAVFDVDLCKE